MIEINDNSKCCGCHACTNACPKSCITMKRDGEGFLYPSIDKYKCIECGLCEKVCPEINVKMELPFKQDGYIVQIKSDVIREESTAGGAFTAIARYVIKNAGVVFGVTMDEKFSVYHTYVETEPELKKYRNSKYVQSTVGDLTFRQVKEFLNQDRLVCFSGTPCQIEGLKCFLNKEYTNLITVDVVCRAVPSPLVFEKYLELQNERLSSDITNIRFRDKYFGYKYSTMNVSTIKNNVNYHHGIESDPWLRAFFSGICNRPSCHKCSFKKRYRVSDFTIWDCFNIQKFSKEMDDDKGTTRMLIHTDKGREIFEKISRDIRSVKVESNDLVDGVKEMYESTMQHSRREEFMSDLNRLDAKNLFDKYFPNKITVKLERITRLAMYKLGVYSMIKNIYARIRKK